MARTAQTAKKTTGGPAKRLMLARPEAASSRPAKRMRAASSASDVVLCSLCEEGGNLYECDEQDCHRAVCTHCVHIPAATQLELASPGVRFCCVSCHWSACRKTPSPYFGFTENGKPVLDHFLQVNGTFQSSTKANIYAAPTLLLHFRLSSIRHRAHFDVIEDVLRDYYPDNGRLQSIDIPFNLAADDDQLEWPTHAGKIMSRIRSSGYTHVVAVVTNHTDDDRGDFWLGSSEKGKEPGAAAVEEWMDLVLGPFKDILQGSVMYFVSCGAIVRNKEAFSGFKAGLSSLGVDHALAFDAPRLSPIKTIDLLMNVTKSMVLHNFKFAIALEHALKNATMLGKHSAVIHVAGSVNKYVWSHKDYQPWGTALPLQCPQCGILDSWTSIYVPGGLGAYRFECRSKVCGWVEGRKVNDPHQITVSRPHNGVLLNSGWIRFEIA